MLTRRSELQDKMEGYESGADYYFVKPIDYRELICCIRSLFRRLLANRRSNYWTLDLSLRQLSNPDGQALEFTAQELMVLKLLIQTPGRIVDREQFFVMFGYDKIKAPDSRLNMLVNRLRKKLVAFNEGFVIKTWRNMGYSYAGPVLTIRKP